VPVRALAVLVAALALLTLTGGMAQAHVVFARGRTPSPKACQHAARARAWPWPGTGLRQLLIGGTFAQW
jgi:hypothetical protein